MRKRSEKKLMHRALDGEINQSETRILKRKLQSDGHVRAEYQELQRMVKETTRIRIQVPANFRKKVMRDVEEETRRRIRK